MAQQVINVGTLPNDGTGDVWRTAWVKSNGNFTDLYQRGSGYLNSSQYGADPTGVNDSAAALNNGIAAVAAAGGGVFVIAPGTYKILSTVTLASNVVLSGYGATVTWGGGAGTMIGCPATGTTNYAGIFGLILNDGATAATMLSLVSGYQCYFRDMQFVGNSTTNTCISMTANTSGTANPQGNLNCVQNGFENISQVQAASGNGNGTLVYMSGNSGVQGLVTDNNFLNLQSQRLNVYGVNFAQWCDSNIFAGMTRISLNGNISPANGIAVGLATTAAQGGVYSELFEQLAIDTFGTPGTDNRQGVVCTNLLSTKNIHVWVLEMGPQRESAATNFAAGAMLSGVINISPRTSSNYQNINMVGTNLSVGNTNPNTQNATVYAAAGQWLSAATQYIYFAQSSCLNQGTPTLGVSYAAQPGANQSGSAYTVAQVMGFQCAAGSNGANATVTNSYGFYCADQAYASSNNYGFYSNMASGAGKFGFYAGGTAANVFTGATQVGGTATNDNASAGFVGEFVQSIVGSGSAVNLTTATPANVTSISLTAGDWDVIGAVAFLPAATTTVTVLEASTGTTSATIGPFTIAATQMIFASFTPGNSAMSLQPQKQRFSLSSTTTVYLVAQSAFGTSTMGAYGSISARRVR